MLRLTTTLTVLLLGLALTQACTSTKSAKPEIATSEPHRQPIPADLSEAVHRSEAVGRQLFVLDKVSSVATDALIEKVGDLKSQNIAGYLPVRDATASGQPSNNHSVLFYTQEQPPRIKFEVKVGIDAKSTTAVYDPPKDLPPAMLELVKARHAAINAAPHEEQPMNALLLPADLIGKTGILVYLIAGTKRPDVVVVGRHYRAVVPFGTAEVSEIMPLSKSVLELSTKGPQGQKLEALMVTHLVSDFPLETHVLASLQSHLPLLVATRRGGWLVKGDHIEYWGAFPEKESK